MKKIKQIAIIGSTASGKTSLAIKIAKKMNSYILSLDSLSIYKEIDIVSAKPTKIEQDGIKHFGIDIIYPTEAFDVTIFIELYHQAYKQCLKDSKNLIIVGGTGFYLKMLLDGVSSLPKITKETQSLTNKYLLNLSKAYSILNSIDTSYMSKIKSNDIYRIEKALNIYLETNMTPSQYFLKNPPIATIQASIPIYQIEWDREILRKRVEQRTHIMVNNGLMDEICMLEKKYTRKPNAMKAIGIKETLAYLDGIYTKNEMIHKISINTARLAKRQKTFNNSQFKNVIKGSIIELENLLL